MIKTRRLKDRIHIPLFFLSFPETSLAKRQVVPSHIVIDTPRGPAQSEGILGIPDHL